MADEKKPAKAPRKGWYEINVSLGNDGEDKHVFVGGCEEGDFRIRRGENVIVPKSVLNRLDDAVQFVDEVDDRDPNKVITVPRKRFPYTIVAAY